jgi:hypothetical protein
MIKGKALNVLKKFTPADLKKFYNFISSPYFNSNNNVIQLFLFLKKSHPDFNHTNESVFNSVFKKKKYNDKVLKNLLSELYKLLERFIIHEAMDEDEFDKNLLLLKGLHQKNLDSLFLKKFDSIKETMELGFKENYFDHQLSLLRENIRFNLARNNMKYITNEIIQKGEFEIFNFLSSMPELIGDIYAVKNNYNINYSSNVCENFIESINFDKFLESIDGKHIYSSIIMLHYHSLMMLIKGDPEDVKHSASYKQFIFKEKDRFDQNYLFNLLLKLEIFYIRKLEQGHEKLIKDYFELCRFRYENNVLINSEIGHMEITLFNNILKVALRVNELEWADKFINNCIKLIHPQLQEDMLELSFAKIEFQQNNFNNALEHLNKIKPKFFHYKIDIRILFLKIFFELNYYDQFITSSDAFRKFIANSETFPVAFKNNMKAFIKYSEKLYKLKSDIKINSFDVHTLNNDMNEFSKNNFIPHKAWLVEKLNEIKEKCNT